MQRLGWLFAVALLTAISPACALPYAYTYLRISDIRYELLRDGEITPIQSTLLSTPPPGFSAYTYVSRDGEEVLDEASADAPSHFLDLDLVQLGDGPRLDNAFAPLASAQPFARADHRWSVADGVLELVAETRGLAGDGPGSALSEASASVRLPISLANVAWDDSIRVSFDVTFVQIASRGGADILAQTGITLGNSGRIKPDGFGSFILDVFPVSPCLIQSNPFLPYRLESYYYLDREYDGDTGSDILDRCTTRISTAQDEGPIFSSPSLSTTAFLEFYIEAAVEPGVVPEPHAPLLVTGGLLALGYARRRSPRTSCGDTPGNDTRGGKRT